MVGRCDTIAPAPVPPGQAGASCFKVEDEAA
jgi:hypothetical protein